MKKPFLFLFIILSLLVNVRAQQAAALIRKANSVLADVEMCELHLTIMYFPKAESYQPESIDSVLYIKKGEMSFYQAKEEITLVNNDYRICINEKVKFINVMNLEKRNHKNKEYVIVPDIDSSFCRILEKEKDIVKIEYAQANNPYGLDKIVFAIDSFTGFWKNIEYYYTARDGVMYEKIVFQINSFDTKCIPPYSMFDERQFVKCNKQECFGTGERKDYQVVVSQY